ncbi:MAG: Zn-ribbon domain-containing OB-fold protein [Candidatus Thermoplasmatota archaeon]|jgi:uncharacterized OB-fold protein|nr:Zn-ribbon domain-containing OB-fold protein [Candidatus Thermoplasmatota archaeon]
MTDAAVPRFWREIPQRYNLIANQCGVCDKVYFPTRESCPYCRRKSIGKMKNIKLGGKGEVVTYTIIHEAPEQFEGQAPYPIAVIKLDEGVKLTAQIVDCDPKDVKIGMRVQSTFRKIQEDGSVGAIYYGYKFRPVK